MAENVDIGNVGGDGVASEVTLARLTATMELMARKKGVNPAEITAKMKKVMDASSKVIDENKEATEDQTKEVDKSTKHLGKFSKGLLGIAGSFGGVLKSSVSGLAGAFMTSEGKLTDFTDHFPLIGGVLSPLVGLIDQNVDSFRELSNVGAQFGDGLNDIRRTATEAGMPLSHFTQLVGENADRMRYFGATTAQGAANFARMSKQLRDGPGRAFMNMGFTATELNEGLLDYAEFTGTLMNSERRMNSMSTKGATDYLDVVNDLARVTGKRRDQIKEELNAAGADARSRLAMSQMDAKQALQFAAGLQTAGNASAAMKEAMIDMSDGVANNPMTAQLSAMSDTFRDQAADFKNMDAGQQNNFLAAVKDDIDQRAKQLGDTTVQGLIGVGGVMGDVFQAGADMRMMVFKDADRLAADAEAAAKQSQIDGGILQFSETLNKIRSNFMAVLTDEVHGEMDEDGNRESILGMFTQGITTAGESLMKFIETDGFALITSALTDLATVFSTFMQDIKDFGFISALFGGEKEVSGGPGGSQTVETKGLFGNLFSTIGDEDGPIMKMFNNVMDVVVEKVVPALTQVLIDAVSAMWDGIKSGFNISWDDIFIGGIAGLGLLIAAPIIGIPGALAAAVIAVIGYQKLVDALGVAWDAITGVFTGITDWWDTVDLMAPLTNMWAKVTGFFDFGEEGFSISALFGKAWDVVTGYFSFAGEVWSGIGGLFDEAWTKVTGWLGFGDKTWSLSDVFKTAWDTVTGFFSMDTLYSIGALADAAWTKVTGWFGFGEGVSSFSISQLASDAWTKVTSFFSMDTLYSIGTLADAAWTKVTGWFGFGEGESLFSISQLAKDAWATVTGFFSFGEGESLFSISQLATDAWKTVTGWFGFGEGESAYSISGIASGAWETVKGWFSFDNFEFPSITGLFNNVWEKLTGFFDFDFELPSFKSFLPAWMGGGDESTDITVDASPAADGANALMDTQTAMASFANIEGLENNLNAIKNGLDIDSVTSYTEAMKQLVAVLEELNAELNKDNYTGYGNGTNAGTVVDKMQTIGSGGGGSSEELNNTMQQVLAVLSSIRTGTDLTANNTRNIVGSNLARSSVSNIG